MLSPKSKICPVSASHPGVDAGVGLASQKSLTLETLSTTRVCESQAGQPRPITKHHEDEIKQRKPFTNYRPVDIMDTFLFISALQLLLRISSSCVTFGQLLHLPVPPFPI